MPAKKNPYFYFVIHFREEKKKKLNITYKSFEEASRAAGPVWSGMSKEERDKFALSNLPSNLINNYGEPAIEKKYTSQGKLIDDLEKEKKNQIRNAKYKLKYIDGLVENAAETNSLEKLEIFFIHANFYCQIKGEYHHAEMAISKFNLEQGVIDTFHTFIDPGPLPSGTTAVAQQKSEKEHHIPLPGRAKGCVPITDDYYSLFHTIRKFAEKAIDQNGKCVMYTLADTLQQTENFLLQIYNETDMSKPFEDYFGVFDLHDLFYKLGNACRMKGRQVGYETSSIPKFITDKDEYDSWSSIACDFHNKEDAAPYCSKSIVTRWAYYICKDSCGFLNITLQRTKHFPTELPVADEVPVNNAWNKPKKSVSAPAQNEYSLARGFSNTPSSNPLDSMTNQVAWIKSPPVLEEAEIMSKSQKSHNSTSISVNRSAVPIGAWGKPLVMKSDRQQRFNAPIISHNKDRDFPLLGERFDRPAARNKTMSRGGKSTTTSRGSNFNSAIRLHELSDDDDVQNPNVPHNDLDYAGLKRPNDNDSDYSIEDIDKILNMKGENLDEAWGGNNGFIRNGDNDEESFAVVRQRLNPTPSNAWPTNTNIGHLSKQNKRIAAKFSTPLEHPYKEKN